MTIQKEGVYYVARVNGSEFLGYSFMEAIERALNNIFAHGTK